MRDYYRRQIDKDPNMPPWSYWVAMAVVIGSVAGWLYYLVGVAP
jgi:hypothetical protein